MRSTLALIIVAALLAVVTDANQVNGCGGFVRVSEAIRATGAKLDLTAVTVTVEDAHSSHTTSPAPNGYYFIPVETSGTFEVSLKTPAGWGVVPSTQTVTVSSSLVCHGDEDINFVVSGFRVSGHVATAAACTAPDALQAVTVVLSHLDSAVPRQSAVTGARGAFAFDNVLPGTYQLSAVHASWAIDGHREVTVGGGSVDLGPALSIRGYAATGSVESGGEPLMGVDVRAFLAGTTTEAAHTTSAGDGTFVLPGLPCGEYDVRAVYTSGQTTFDVSPAEVPLVVKGGNAVLGVPFRVVGFSVSGRVVDAQNRGVSGASVLVDGAVVAHSDADGFYHIEQMTAGTYDITARLDGVFFASLASVQVSPSRSRLPEVAVTGYALCGAVVDADPIAGSTVVLQDGSSGEALVRRVLGADAAFCFEVASGSYLVTVEPSAAAAAAGVAFSAPLSVSVVDAPVVGVQLAPRRASLAGTVACVGGTCASLEAVVTRDGASVATVPVSADGAFAVPDLVPATYHVALTRRDWCWEARSQEVAVGGTTGTPEDTTTVQFTQKGFTLALESAQATRVAIAHDATPEDPPTEVDLRKGKTGLCLPSQGTYTITPAGCHQFSAPSFAFDTSAPAPVVLTATAFKVTGSLSLASGVSPPAQLAVEVAAAGSVETVVATASPGDPQTFAFAFFVAPGATVTVAPAVPSLLATPASVAVTHDGRGCADAPEVAFVLSSGTTVHGRVEGAAAVGGVAITGASEDGTHTVTTVTAADGSYSLGPMHSHLSYHLSAAKPGFHFLETEAGVFAVVELGAIEVRVIDATSGAPVGEVLLSLSGDDYRSNVAVPAQGTLSFDDLYPGEYFLRPMHKEFTFDPATTSITVAQGAHTKTTIKATRVAFSVFGAVTNLGGSPEKGVVIEAVSADAAHRETTETNAHGAYRLRGILPGVAYAVRVLGEQEGVARASPDAHPVAPVKAAADVSGLDFVVVPAALNKLVISGTAQINASASVAEDMAERARRDQTAVFSVQLLGPDSNDVVAEQAVMGAGYFRFVVDVPTGVTLDVGTYRVRVATVLSARIYDLGELIGKPVLVDPASPVVALHGVVSVREESEDISVLPFFVFVAIILGALYLVYHKQVRTWYANVVFVPEPEVGTNRRQRRR